MSTRWIEDWFGSEYYALLYKHRNNEEAHLFLNNLIDFLKLPAGIRILDCGCGKGRHSVYLSNRGFHVTGLDISKTNILESNQYAHNQLEFFIHDMRTLFRINYYPLALNIFTSFGYFNNDFENNKVIKTTASALTANGVFVLDFMNAAKEIKDLVAEEGFTITNIDFRIHRHIQDNCIVKDIQVSHLGKELTFRENVKGYLLSDLKLLFEKNQLDVEHVFGDYNLTPFDEKKSNRLILIGIKKQLA